MAHVVTLPLSGIRIRGPDPAVPDLGGGCPDIERMRRTNSFPHRTVDPGQHGQADDLISQAIRSRPASRHAMYDVARVHLSCGS